MSWRLRISHVTEVRYSGPVLSSFNEARMTPLTLPAQVALQTRLAVGHSRRSGTAPTWTYDDYWGTRVTVFDLPEAHDDLVIRATAIVETSAAVPVRAERRPGWGEIREAVAHGRLIEYILPTPLTTVTPDVVDAAISDISADGGRGGAGGGLKDVVAAVAARMAPDEAAAAISARVREHVTYTPGATGVRTGAQGAWDKGQGVCQDMAHVTVSLLRAVGLPARYVSGYLHPKADPAPGATAIGRGHAWAEYWAGDWTPLDPASGVPVGERHVVVARGRDYADVPPLKGTYRGAPDATMNVTVEVTRLA